MIKRFVINVVAKIRKMYSISYEYNISHNMAILSTSLLNKLNVNEPIVNPMPWDLCVRYICRGRMTLIKIDTAEPGPRGHKSKKQFSE